MPELAAILAAMSLGAMLFFSAIVAPTTFAALPSENAGAFLRALFPKYFLINGVVAGVAGLLVLGRIESVILLVCCAAMLGVTFWMIPIINTARDRMIAGAAGAKAEFDWWHRASVVVNLVEMIGLVGAILLLLRVAI